MGRINVLVVKFVFNSFTKKIIAEDVIKYQQLLSVIVRREKFITIECKNE